MLVLQGKGVWLNVEEISAVSLMDTRASGETSFFRTLNNKKRELKKKKKKKVKGINANFFHVFSYSIFYTMLT